MPQALLRVEPLLCLQLVKPGPLALGNILQLNSSAAGIAGEGDNFKKKKNLPFKVGLMESLMQMASFRSTNAHVKTMRIQKLPGSM